METGIAGKGAGGEGHRVPAGGARLNMESSLFEEQNVFYLLVDAPNGRLHNKKFPHSRSRSAGVPGVGDSASSGVWPPL